MFLAAGSRKRFDFNHNLAAAVLLSLCRPKVALQFWFSQNPGLLLQTQENPSLSTGPYGCSLHYTLSQQAERPALRRLGADVATLRAQMAEGLAEAHRDILEEF